MEILKIIEVIDGILNAGVEEGGTDDGFGVEIGGIVNDDRSEVDGG